MAVDPTKPNAGTHVPPVSDQVAPGVAPGAPTVVPVPAGVDSAAASADLQRVQGGGRRARSAAVLPTGFLDDVMGAELRRRLEEAQANQPKLPQELLQTPSRGAVMVKTSAGWIQFGLPMWTNKDAFASFAGQGGFAISKEELALKIPHMIPLVYVVDTDYVDHMLGTDFLQYMFFVTKGTKFTMIAQHAEDAAKIQRFLDLSYEGPRGEALSASVAAEYPEGAQGIPNMMAELTRGFGGSPPATAMRAIEHLDGNGEFALPGVTIRKVGSMQYEVVDQGQSLGVVNLKDYPLPKAVKPVDMDPALQAVRQKALIEGRPGLWAIGTGHGFVPNEETSGFMIFGQGREGSGKIVLVDPPSSTPEYLLANGIPLEAIEGVILTHGHTDHYGDAVPKLLRLMPRLKIYTTPTIQQMLQEQYELGVGGKHEGLTQWNFVPVRPQRFTEIVGLHFKFEYGFHTVPTIGFDLYDKPGGRCIAFFTGDTFADFANIWPHTKKGPNGEEPVMSMARALNVTRHLGHVMGSQGQQPPIVGLIEAGIPPIHTDPATTKELLDAAAAKGIDVSRVLVYHIAAKAAADAGVAKWQAGHEGFIDISPFFADFVPTNEIEYAARILNKMPLLDELGPDLKAAILKNGQLKKVDSGTVLLQAGHTDEKVYFLIDGEVQVSKDGHVLTTRPNGFYGEGAILGKPRNADVTTTVTSYVLELDVGDLPIKAAAPLKASLQRVRFSRDQAYDVVKNKSPLSIVPDAILDVLFLKATVYPISDGTTFIHEGAMDRDVFVVLDGEVDVRSNSREIDVKLGAGAMLGEMALVDSKPRSASVTAVGQVKVIKFPADSLAALATKYPGIAIAMGRTAEKREARNGNGNDNGRPVPKVEAGYATVDMMALPFTLPAQLAKFVAEKIPAAAAQTLRGGFVFFAGDQLSEMALGRFHMPDVKALATDYAALTAGGKVGELGLTGVLKIPAAQAVSQPAKAILGRAVPLFSALMAQEWVHNGKVDLAQLPVSAGNVLAASGIVSATTAAMATSEKISTLGKFLRLASVGGKATLLGAVVSSAAEFLIIKQLNALEMQLAQSDAMAQIRSHLASLLQSDHIAIAALAEGQSVPASYFNAIDAQLSEYEKTLDVALNAKEQQVLSDDAQARASLKEWRAAKTARPLDGTWSYAEIDAQYRERLAAIAQAKNAAMAAAAVPQGQYAPLPVDPQGDWSLLMDAADEDDFKADLDMDGNPVHEDSELRYQAMLAHDWKTLSAQIAQYRKDRATAIEKYQRQLPPRVMPIELAMN